MQIAKVGSEPLDAAERAAMRAAAERPEAAMVARLTRAAGLDAAARARISDRAAALVRRVRAETEPGMMEAFLAEYGLSTREGVALMCLAEALLRTPDAETIDALIADKIAHSDWSAHLGKAASPLVSASTWALMLTGRVLREDEAGLVGTLRGAVRRLGEPVIRVAVGRAMALLGRQFVLGRTIGEALDRAAEAERAGWLHSYDMLGEAARTAGDAQRYFASYAQAIAAIGKRAKSGDPAANPGISIKLSALHPRYEEAQRDRAMAELVPRLADLAAQAAAAGLGLNVDAEEAERLELSLDVIAAALEDPRLQGWDGFGAVVQAYGPRALPVIDWLHELAGRAGRRLMVRLVKGAYWDAEIKRAQVLGLERFEVFTRKPATDVSYIACARRLLDGRDRLFAQFATHNAHTVAAVMEMAGKAGGFEFQRLHGMGAALHGILRAETGVPCRIYAPVGAHRDLLAYLVRRLLENGANSSFVHQIVDESIAPEEIAADPFARIEALGGAVVNPAIRTGAALFAERRNSRGFDLAEAGTRAAIETARAPWVAHRWRAGPLLAAKGGGGPEREVPNPARPSEAVGTVAEARPEDVGPAMEAALAAQPGWAALGATGRAEILNRAADLYEARFGELFAIAAREAGKGLPDAVAELREAVDFLRYYAGQAPEGRARGVFACISPWNFPLAIFTGQIAAALAAGNAVLAKPAEQTPIMAHRAVRLLHEAGVPRAVLQLLPGPGETVGAALSAEPRLGGLVFTGSTDTARAIARAMAGTGAEGADPAAPLIAETGGLNAMIVDSTALPEQAVRDILISAFQSAGQRCSALRMLYVQEDIAAGLLDMLEGAMAELRLGDPWDLSTDVGPVIEAAARADIDAHIARAREEGRLIAQIPAPREGHFVGPALIRVSGIGDLEREVFGPVLHVATFRAEDLEAVIEAVNATGHGLTFGLHSRIDDRVETVSRRVRAGNLYVNRNQIGAIVGSQPFGGEGLSGTGPKAGGPAYVPRFTAGERRDLPAAEGRALRREEVAAALAALPAPDPAPRSVEILPGPTGETNRLSTHARGVVLCLGPGAEAAGAQEEAARMVGCAALAVAPGAEGLSGVLPAALLADLPGIDAVLFEGPDPEARAIRRALAARPGKLVPLIRERPFAAQLLIERHLCVDTTAAGGNATLLAAAGG